MLIAATFGAALLFWFITKPWVTDPTWSSVDYHTWLWPLLALMVIGAIAGTALTLLDTYYLRFAASGVIGLAFLMAFGLTMLNLLAIAVMLLFHFWAMRNMRGTLRNHLTINFRSVVNSGMRHVITPLLIMISFAYFANPNVQASAEHNQLPPAITKAVETVSRVISRNELSGLSPNQQIQTERQLNQEVIDFLNREAKPYRRYFPPVLAFGLFIVLEGLAFLFVPISSYAAAGLFNLLKSLEFIRISEKDVKAQELFLS